MLMVDLNVRAVPCVNIECVGLIAPHAEGWNEIVMMQ